MRFKCPTAKRIDLIAIILCVCMIAIGLINIGLAYVAVSNVNSYSSFGQSSSASLDIAVYIQAGIYIVLGFLIEAVLSGFAVIVERNYRQVEYFEKKEETGNYQDFS